MMTLDIDTGSGARRVDLFTYLEPDREERAQEDAYTWIKAIRGLRVDGETFRTRFTFRGDSLWWFAELFLHKDQAVLNAHRIIAAFDTLIEVERPLAVTYVAGRYAGVLAAAAAARTVRYGGPRWPNATTRLVRMDVRASALAFLARGSRLRAPSVPSGTARVAAFVHRAFWRTDGVADARAESYIGPVLRALEHAVSREEVRYVGVGPSRNFRARRWWDPLRAQPDAGIVPIEHYAPAAALTDSRRLFGERHAVRRALWASADLRAHAVIDGCDCWPLIREQLAGIALLQFPWSARAMDEAAAALDVLQPRAATTYAEAGGWGRALALECRRRGIPLAGLQHGFIYRHWLNYRHEPDETEPDPRNPSDPGFPFPALTLLYDEQTSEHLRNAGRFPPSLLAVTGSPRLDELKAAMAKLDAGQIKRVRHESGASETQRFLLFAAKEREARRALPALVAAVREMPEVHLAIKPHPAETPDVYASAAADVPNIRVLPADAQLPALLAAADAIVTVNSTVAVDGLALGIPALVIGLPNNLTPFVDAGLMAGAGSQQEIRTALAQVLYDQEFRSRSKNVLAAVHDAQAAVRAADAIVRLATR